MSISNPIYSNVLNTNLPYTVSLQSSLYDKTKLPTKLNPFKSSTKSGFNFADNMSNIGDMAGTLSSLIPDNDQSSTTNGIDSVYDIASNEISKAGPVGAAIGGAMKVGGLVSDGLSALGFKTDQMTTTDKILDSKFMKLSPLGIVNTAFGKKTKNFNLNTDTWNDQGSSYMGSLDLATKAKDKSRKTYGLLSSGSRNSANNLINKASLQQNKITDINTEAQDAFTTQRTGLNYLLNKNNLNLNGGYQQNNNYIGKNGMKFPSLENINKAKSLTKKFEKGGKFNVIPEGALHARKNNMDVDGITKKGIPVISENGGELTQHAEIEKNEIVFNIDVTNKLEELAKDGSDEAAIEAGKLIAKEIMENTIDNTGLIKEVTT